MPFCVQEGEDLVGILNHEAVLSALSHSEQEGKSLKEIAQAIGLQTPTYVDWIRAERSLARVLRILIKWGMVSRGRRQRTDGHKFWHNVYWKTDLAILQESAGRE